MTDKEMAFSDKPIDYNSLDFKKERFYHNLVVPVIVENRPGDFNYARPDFLDASIEQLKIQLRADIWSHTVGEKTITLDRPTFLDWLLRRRKKITVRAQDMFIEPPALPEETVRIYKWRGGE